MWQRKQTIYLLLVTILLLTLQVLPLMLFNTTANISASATGLQGMPRELYCAMIYNPAVNTQDGSQYTVGTVTLLAVVSVAAAIISFASIFIFKNRKRQMRNCRNAQILLLLWCGLCAWIAYSENEAGIKPQFGLCLPIVSIILLQLAHKGIKHDDDLVRSVDRLR